MGSVNGWEGLVSVLVAAQNGRPRQANVTLRWPCQLLGVETGFKLPNADRTQDQNCRGGSGKSVREQSPQWVPYTARNLDKVLRRFQTTSDSHTRGKLFGSRFERISIAYCWIARVAKYSLEHFPKFMKQGVLPGNEAAAVDWHDDRKYVFMPVI